MVPSVNANVAANAARMMMDSGDFIGRGRRKIIDIPDNIDAIWPVSDQSSFPTIIG